MRERDQFLVQFCWRFQCNCSVFPAVRNDWVDPHIPLVEASESNRSGSVNIKKIVHLFSGNSTSITTNEFHAYKYLIFECISLPVPNPCFSISADLLQRHSMSTLTQPLSHIFPNIFESLPHHTRHLFPATNSPLEIC